MATAPQTGLADALCGLRLEYEELREALARFDLASIFGGITAEEIVSLMLEEGEGE